MAEGEPVTDKQAKHLFVTGSQPVLAKRYAADESLAPINIIIEDLEQEQAPDDNDLLLLKQLRNKRNRLLTLFGV